MEMHGYGSTGGWCSSAARGSSATPLLGLVLRIGLLLQDVRVCLTLRTRRAALQLLWVDLRPDKQAVKVEGWTDQICQQPLFGRLCSPCLCALLGRSYTGGNATAAVGWTVVGREGTRGRLGRGGREWLCWLGPETAASWNVCRVASESGACLRCLAFPDGSLGSASGAGVNIGGKGEGVWTWQADPQGSQ